MNLQEQQEQYDNVAVDDYNNQITSITDHGYTSYESQVPVSSQRTSPQSQQQSQNQNIKRETSTEKENNETTEQVTVTQSPAVYVELKNESDELRYTNPHVIRYDLTADRYSSRFIYPAHHSHPPTADDLKAADIQNQQIQIYDTNSQSVDGQLSQDSQTENKTHYTNLETVHSLPSTTNYYITSESYQPPGGNFTYLHTPNKETYALYHAPNSPNPVLYKGEEKIEISFSDYFIRI